MISVNTPVWAVTMRYAGVPGSRPESRRHPTPEDFIRRTLVGPASTTTIEALLDLLDVSKAACVNIRTNEVVKNFVEGRLIPDEPYPHAAMGARYVNYVNKAPRAQLEEWSIEFSFVTRVLVD